MIPEVLGDIFDTPPDTTVIAHQANCFNTLGDGIAHGIAGVIGKRYPEAAAADAATVKGDKSKMGTFSVGKCEDGRIVANIYSQFEYTGDRPTSYDAVVTGMEALRAYLTQQASVGKEYTLALPYGYGSLRGGGSWHIVKAIIESVFSDVPFDVIIVRLPAQATLK
jgi:hypothetical protein